MERAGFSARVNQHDAEVRRRVGRDVAEAPAGSGDDDPPARQVRRRQGQPDLGGDRKLAPNLEWPADADRDVSGATLARADRRDAAPGFADRDEDLAEVGERLLDGHAGPRFSTGA